VPQRLPRVDRRARFNGFKLLELLHQHIPADFDPDDFVIAGSARLWAGGISSHLSDLDIVARAGSATWRRSLELAFEHALVFDTPPLRKGQYSGDKIAVLYGGVIEVCQTWILPDRETASLIDEADVIDGLNYMSLNDVKAYKEKLSRGKDLLDLAVLERRSAAAAASDPWNSQRHSPHSELDRNERQRKLIGC
jgi:hypothetical protein